MPWFADAAPVPAAPPSRSTAVLGQLESHFLLTCGYPVAVSLIDERMGTYSRILRVRIHFREGAVTAYVKHYEADERSPRIGRRFRWYVVTEYKRTELARQCSTPWATVPRPLACLPDHLIVVTEEAPGRSLDQHLRAAALRRGGWRLATLCRDLRRVGAWLRRFQEGVPPLGTRPPDKRAYLDLRLKELVSLGRPAFTEAERCAMLAAFDAHARGLAPDDLRVVPTHSDLCPVNILADEAGITVLDFAGSADGGPYDDLAHLTAHLRLAGQRFRLGERATARLVRALLDGYSPGFDENAPPFRAALLSQLACRMLGAAGAGYFDGMFGEARFRRFVARCAAIGGVSLRPAR